MIRELFNFDYSLLLFECKDILQIFFTWSLCLYKLKKKKLKQEILFFKNEIPL